MATVDDERTNRANIPTRAGLIGREAASLYADEVDRAARFPTEAIEALRRDRLLSVAVPTQHGGEAADLDEVAGAVRELSQSCASTGMVYAMHQIQVWCLVRHGHTPALQAELERVATDQVLLASATTEAGVGGDVRTSRCALEPNPERGPSAFRLEKQAPVISYGENADAVLATARRRADSPPSDQVLVYCAPPGLHLDPVSEWDTLGFRGTASRGFRLVAEGESDHVLSDPFGEISAQTMLPVSHILWASVWLGLAEAAAAIAHRFIRGEARKNARLNVAGAPPAATRLAELSAALQEFRGLLRGATRLYGEHLDDPDRLGSLSFAVAMNTLKVSASTLVVEIVGKALSICGMAGYRQDSPFSLGRLLRDAYGAALMVNNDRIIANSAQLLLASKEI